MDSNKGELSKEIKYSLEQIEKNLKKTEKCIENIYNHLGKIKKRDSEEYDKTTQGELTPRAINENFTNFDINMFSDEIKEGGISQRDDMLNKLQIAYEFISESSEKKCNNLFFLGGSGTGKTYLSNCIANDYIHKSCTVKSYTALEFFDYIQRNLFNNSSYKMDYDILADCDLLIIDNLGTEIINNFTKGQLLQILDKRFSNYKKTIIITSMTLGSIRETYGEMIFSRLFGDCRILLFMGEDLRWEIYK
ncbi:TPA: ATP-binding protein [Clostridioides difficile]|uniref:ATP-binding protein n=3 Tax=Clostridioides difficile TaxID=1496 RepID=UPI00038D970C|nr:ATP-binding protein [Clostridioides difficile]AUA29378.1 hypothetical protein CWR54_10045 [Clostridioides difficile]EGT5160624.1 hypothetical protein [Clostridioides difficile]EJX2707595.1 ATP-binding protein [Clostridioides difficile]ELX4543267.1 ATP-binding protein [Clostridioides difficile]EQH50753.1 istB-like ATP binding family protein [Clostridioides difficile DA00246]